MEEQLKAVGELEVELDGGALVTLSHGVADGDVDLGAIEGAISRVELPLEAGGDEGLLQLLFSLIPDLNVAEELLRAGGERHGEAKAKDGVDVLEEVKGTLDLLFDLLRGAEDVGIILLEPADTGEAGEGPAELIAVEDSKVGQPERELAVRAGAEAEHEAVARAVHGLEGKLLALNVKAKHVLLVVLPVSGALPELGVVHVWGDDLLEAPLRVLGPDEGNEGVVDPGTAWEEEAAARAELVEEEELLVPAYEAVIALLGLLAPLLPLGEALVVVEGDAVDTLEDLVFGLAKPVARGVPVHGVGLDAAGVGDVRAEAEIDQGAAAVHRAGGAVRNLFLDEVDLHVVVLGVGTGKESVRKGCAGGKERACLALNISRSSSLVSSRRSNSCDSLTTCLQSFSITGKSRSEMVSPLEKKKKNR